MRTIFEHFWSDWRSGLAAAAALAAGAALLSALLTPRGPVTPAQAVGSMAAAFLVGLAAGLVMGSYWSLLATPLVSVAVFELARLNVTGPTVDAIQLGSTYGVIAFVLGRLVHGLLVISPLVLGAAYGVGFAARLGGPAAPMGAFRWTVIALLTVSHFVVVFFFARTGTTAPIVGSDGHALPQGIAELVTVPIGGHDQALMIRGRSVENPVLLYLAGGPGGTDLGAMRADVSLEQDFIVVVWEQRGAGKSYASLDPADTLTLQGMVADTIEVTNYLRGRFDAEKIYLVGNSWGTILGVLAVQGHPELYYAYVGTGQMVSPRETDIMFYEDTLAWAERTGDSKLVAALKQNGPPPYENLLAYEPAISHEHDWNPYPDLDRRNEMPANLFVRENSLMDRINGLRAFLDVFSILYPQIQDIDFRKDAVSLQVPVYIVQGKYEARGRSVLAYEWFEKLSAPAKEMILFDHSGHRPLFEEPAAFAEVMRAVRSHAALETEQISRAP